MSPIEKLIQQLPTYNLDCIAVLPGFTMRYLTGLNFHLMERPIVAFFPMEGKPALVAPEFECAQVDTPATWRLFPWRDEEGVEGAFEACCQALNLSGRRVGVETLVMRVKEYTLLKTFAPQTTIVPADPLITALRSIKNTTEIEQMQRAVQLAEAALEQTLSRIKIGMTEKELAAELLIQLLRAGSETVPFDPLVQTGPSGANPHGMPGDRKLAVGDLLIIDFGTRAAGYASDITRTFAVGAVNAEAQKIHNIVRQANQAGREIAGPGVACEAVDRAARTVIEEAGYGKYFTHRTGHGLGMEGHEPPFMVAGNATPLQPGMAFTVEPGIYVPGLGGVRIEDDVVVTETGVRSLTTFSRALRVVGE